MKTNIADDLLPSKPTKAIRDPSRLKYLFIAQPKWGKTSTLCSFPEMLLLATEEGHAFHTANKLIIDCWDYPTRSEEEERAWSEDDDGNKHVSMVLAAETILDSSKFQFIGVDTTDMAAKMCLDFHYARKKVEHASDAGDWGKGWDITLNQPFRKAMTLLLKSGRGVGFTTHLNVIEKKVGSMTVSRFETTLPSGVQRFVHTQCDLIIHGTFGKKRKGLDERDRIIILDGSNEVLAGSRVRDVYLPKRFIVSPKNPWEQLQGFFEDESLAKEAEAEYSEFYGVGKPELQVPDDDNEVETTTTTNKEKVSGKDKPSLKNRATRRKA